jgi:SAM-dependent methyltransferase
MEWIGSEYLAPTLKGGTVKGNLRHEDVECLSFADGSFDLVVSNDVLEHVNDPQQALRETFRVLRAGGEFLLTVPFHTAEDRNVRRAEVVGGNVVHHLPAVYHGNPISAEGSLVFTDFGWEFLDQMRSAGFVEVALYLYWAKSHGYFGVAQHYMRAIKPMLSD